MSWLRVVAFCPVEAIACPDPLTVRASASLGIAMLRNGEVEVNGLHALARYGLVHPSGLLVSPLPTAQPGLVTRLPRETAIPRPTAPQRPSPPATPAGMPPELA